MKLVKWNLNPVNLTCLIMLFITMITVLTSNRPAEAPAIAPKATPEAHFHECQYEGLECPIKLAEHTKDMKEYQVEIIEGYAIFFDYGRTAFVVPFDKGCNLTKAVEHDNQ
jgi:hypothetical protein